MEHTEAIDTGAAERYALGEMSEAERDQYEEHFFDCPDCADEVRSAALFLENAGAVAREGDVGKEDIKERSVARPRASWDWRSLFLPMPLAAAAALVLLLGGPAGYLALVKVPQLEQTIAADQALRPAPSYFLKVSRSDTPVLTVRDGERSVILTLSRSSEQSFAFYRCEVVEANGRIVVSSVIPAPPSRDELQILLHIEKLSPGNYVLRVTGLESASAKGLAQPTEYHFVLKRGEPGA